MRGFKPFGIPMKVLESLELFLDEYESIRLLDYEGLTQEEAAIKMEVSRPTLTRIYEKARKKIAQAFVEGKMIQIEGGKVEFESDWYRCTKCHKLIEGIENHVRCKNCPDYGQNELVPVK
jgi:predicted DNA-binding protein (UPF0251 family)